MAQFGYPTSDITRGAWTDQGGGATHWGNLDEVSYSDTDFIQLNNQTANVCEVGLNTLSDPNVNTGHIVHLRVRKTGSGTISLTVALIENTTSRASRSVTLTTSFADVSFALTGTEADTITDYTNLRIRFTGTCAASGRFIAVSWANLETPSLAYVLQTDTGVFTLTGNNGILDVDHKLLVDVGSYIWTRNDAILTIGGGLTNYLLQTTTGSFVWTGNDARVLQSRLIKAATGIYELDDDPRARLLVARQARITAGSFVLSGSVMELIAHKLYLTTGLYTWDGNNSILARSYKILAAAGSYLWVGNDAILEIGGGAAGYKLQTITGSFIWTRNDGKAFYHRVITATGGSYSLASGGVRELWVHKIFTASGSFLWDRKDGYLLENRILRTSAGIYILDGKNAVEQYARKILASPGSFVITGDVWMLALLRLMATGGIYIWTGNDAILTQRSAVLVGEGEIVFASPRPDIIPSEVEEILSSGRQKARVRRGRHYQG